MSVEPMQHPRQDRITVNRLASVDVQEPLRDDAAEGDAADEGSRQDDDGKGAVVVGGDVECPQAHPNF